METHTSKWLLTIGAALLVGGTVVNAAELNVSITNNAATTYLTPAWVGFHDGSFDTFNINAPASTGLEGLAELGMTVGLSGEFQSPSRVDGQLGMAPITPGQTVSQNFTLNENGSNDYFSYAAMLLPSSDFFIGNDGLIDISSILSSVGSSLVLTVFNVFDAGTEVNDFATSPGNGIFGIAAGVPSAGVDEMGVVTQVGDLILAYGSFLNVGNTDFSQFGLGAQIATIELTNVSAVPVPAAAFLFAPALLGFMGLRRRAKNTVA